MEVSFGLLVEVFIATVLVLGILAMLFIQKFSKQKNYYKAIIDNSTNIVVVSDTTHLLSANRTFFTYFSNYKSLKEFSKDHNCICNFFEDAHGYLTPLNDGVPWIDYIMKFQKLKHKVKINIAGEIFYFIISASLLDKKDQIYAIILSDITEQETTKHELVSLSIKDKLTNIGNRKYYEESLHDHIVLAQRYVHDFSLVIFDIDHFKKVNDTLGHDVGDKVLKEYTEYISHLIRRTDLFSRIGGEEFALILPYTRKDKAYSLIQKLRMLVENHKKITPITMSFGVVQYEKGDDEEIIFKRADVALYKAKESGRNKVVLG